MKKKPEPLKYFRDQYEAKKKAMGGTAMMDTSSGPGPKKRNRASTPKRKSPKGKFGSCYSGRCV